MRRWTRTIGRWAAGWLDVPPDAATGASRLTLIGNGRIHVERPGSLRRFSDKELQLELSEGTLEIRGRRLAVREMWPDDVWIEGEFAEVTVRHRRP
ncbi:MAG: hypothetical protein BLM47_07985 [Candidatus Reconcilbacillus cellulovorans]|uniref:Sporulation protein YqfC n=1 Tax=Candidatus Reconcilbacillus cellulovorans TaxID=1906605 RepID=A0A2A6E0E3_9BACL|nr:MAG: hypothetical protein BLM47_07985 [Candidatus Reconcilbacillus cellulovorans]